MSVKKSTIDLGKTDLSALMGNKKPEVFIELDIDKILEDESQPRVDFDEATLQELTLSIQNRGVKTPISVHKGNDGFYIINHGARRFRASKLAGLTKIPAFVDDDYSLIDQLAENIQREQLTPREISDAIGRLLSEIDPETGKKRAKGDIAKLLGKSNSFISQYVSLLNLPDCIAEIFPERCNDVTIINKLITLWKKYPQEIEEYIKSHKNLDRQSIDVFSDLLKGNIISAEVNTEADEHSVEAPKIKNKREDKVVDTAVIKKPIIRVLLNDNVTVNKEATLIINARAEAKGQALIRFDDGSIETAYLKDLTITDILEG